MKKILAFALVVMVGVLIAAPAFAAFDPSNVEFVTNGGFDSIDKAFHRIGLIFSDSGYNGLYAAAAILAVMVGGTALWLRGLSGGKSGGAALAVPLITGIAIYTAFIVPKGKVTVYDTVLNKTQTESNIPLGMTTVAGALNFIETNIIQTIDTSGDPTSYQLSAGGKGIETLLHLFQAGLVSGDSYFDKNLTNYIGQCLYPTLSCTGAANCTDFNKLRQGTQDFSTDILSQPQVASPFNTTVWYSSTGTSSMTCQAAWTEINNWFAAQVNVQKMVNATCSASGFDVTDPVQLNQCQNLIQQYIQMISNGNVNLSALSIVQQLYIAQMMDNAAASNGALQTQSYYQGLNSIGTAVSLNEWIPVMKAVITSIAIGITPFLLLFVPTPLFGKAIGTACGLFLWITIWGITDAVVHQFIIDYAGGIFNQVSNMQLGYDAIMFMPTPLTKVMGFFGQARMFGMGLATVICGTLVKFGGSAMAMAVGQMSGAVQTGAGDAVNKTMTPEGQAHQRMTERSAAGKLGFQNTHSFAATAMAEMGQMGDSFHGGTEKFNAGDNALANMNKGEFADRRGAGLVGGNREEVSAFNKERQVAGTNSLINHGVTAKTAADFDSSGMRSEVSGYGNADNKVASGVQNIQQKVLGPQATDRGTAGTLGFSDMQDFGQFQSRGLTFSKDAEGQRIAAAMDQQYDTHAYSNALTKYGQLKFDGSQINRGDDGRITNAAMGRSTEGATIEIGKDGMKPGATITERSVEGGLTSVTTRDMHGNMMMQEQHGVLTAAQASNLKREMSGIAAMKTGAPYARMGAKVDIVRGSDGQLADVSLSHAGKVTWNSKVDAVDSKLTGKVYENYDKNNNFYERRNESLHTNIQVSREFGEVDKTIATQADADRWNRLMNASGIKNAFVNKGDSIKARTDTMGNLSTISIARGGSREYTDMDHASVGQLTQNYKHRTEDKLGYTVDNVTGGIIREITGSDDAAGALAYGRTAVGEGAGALKDFMAIKSAGELSTTPKVADESFAPSGPYSNIREHWLDEGRSLSNPGGRVGSTGKGK